MNFFNTISDYSFANVVLFFVVIPFVYFYDVSAIAARMHDASLKMRDDEQLKHAVFGDAKRISDLAYVFRLNHLVLLALLTFCFSIVFLGEAVVTSFGKTSLATSVEATDNVAVLKKNDDDTDAFRFQPGKIVHIYSIALGLGFVVYLKWCKSKLIWAVTGDLLCRDLERSEFLLPSSSKNMPPSGFYIPHSSAISSFLASCVDDLQREACQLNISFLSALEREIRTIDVHLASEDSSPLLIGLLELTKAAYERLRVCDVSNSERWVAAPSVVEVLRSIENEILELRVAEQPVERSTSS